MKVVVVDNDAALLRSLEILLSGQGHHVRVFDDPAEACSFINQDSRFDVLIIDYVMPGLSGKEVLQRVRGHLPEHCRVILISGHTDILNMHDLETWGVNEFLPKPLDVNQLRSLISPRHHN